MVPGERMVTGNIFSVPRDVLLTPHQPITERAKVRKAMETTLLTAIMKIITCVNSHKEHIPPITSTDANPFPYQINVNPKDPPAAAPTWGTRMGIF